MIIKGRLRDGEHALKESLSTIQKLATQDCDVQVSFVSFFYSSKSTIM